MHAALPKGLPGQGEPMILLPTLPRAPSSLTPPRARPPSHQPHQEISNRLTPPLLGRSGRIQGGVNREGSRSPQIFDRFGQQNRPCSAPQARKFGVLRPFPPCKHHFKCQNVPPAAGLYPSCFIPLQRAAGTKNVVIAAKRLFRR